MSIWSNHSDYDDNEHWSICTLTQKGLKNDTIVFDIKLKDTMFD